MRHKRKTATEVALKTISVPCPLCGKGKVTMPRIDVVCGTKHPGKYELERNIEKAIQKHLGMTSSELYKEVFGKI